MRRVIVESPYAAPPGTPADVAPEHVERNLRYLRACLADCLARGEAPFASHGLYTQPGVLNDADPEERRHGINAGFMWRLVADVTAVYTDLGISRGMEYGIAHAGSSNRPSEYRQLGGEWAQP